MNEYRKVSTDALLAVENVFDSHNSELIAEICRRAGLLKAFEFSNAETLETVLALAVRILELREARGGEK